MRSSRNIAKVSNNHNREISPIEVEMMKKLADIHIEHKKRQQNLAVHTHKPYAAVTPYLYYTTLTWRAIHGSDTIQRLENTRNKLIMNRRPSL